jgi:1,4-dihydroxy-2-naphthoate polyprenyltransferase
MSIISVTVGTILAAGDGPLLWSWFAATAFGIVCFHAAANTMNDYYDSRNKIDQPDSPTAKYRRQPIISALLTPRQVFGESVVLFAVAATIGVVAAFFRTYYILWIGIAGLLASFFYTAGPIRLKYRGLGELVVFAMWGPLMIEGAYAVQRQALSLKALYVSIPFGLIVALVLLANNMRDIAYDARHDIKTVSIMLGAQRSYLLFAGIIGAAYLSVLGMIAVGVMNYWGLLVFLSVPSAVSILKAFREKIPDMADARAAQFDTVFGILLIIAIVLQNIVPL